MPLGFATLPLGPAELRALAEGDYSIVDQAVRTAGLLIIQSPDEQASGAGRRATEEEEPNATADGAAAADAPASDHPSVARRPTPDA